MAKTRIERVTICNLKCLRKVSVDLAPLTVLIGKNDTGKPSFLDAISWLARGGRRCDITHAAENESTRIE